MVLRSDVFSLKTAQWGPQHVAGI